MKTTRGFTLVEVLISLGILGIIIVALFQTIGSTTGYSNTTNASNDLIREGQIAQQLLNARFKEACYIYPANTIITLSNSEETTRSVFNFYFTFQWLIGTDPIAAVILPPAANGASNNYRFFAYYAIPRSQYVGAVTSELSSGFDLLNDNQVFTLMEYSREIDVSNTTTFPNRRCASLAINSNFNYSGEVGIMLADYIAPTTASSDFMTVGGTAPSGGAAFVTYNLRLQKTTRGDGVLNTVSVGGGASGTTLTARVYPVNLGL